MDYEALAAKFGGAAADQPPQGPVDYEAAAAMFGGQTAEPARKAPVKIGADAFADTLRGELQDQDWITRNVVGAGSALTNAYQGVKDMFGAGDASQITAAKVMAEEAPIGRVAGEVAMLAPTMAIPGAGTIRGAAAIGAATGGLLTPGSLHERVSNSLLSAGLGAAGGFVSKRFAGRAPYETPPAVQRMESEGVALTPGVVMGGTPRLIEDRLTSVPFLGDVIQRARVRGVEDFNKAVLARGQLPGSQAGGEIGGDALQTMRGEFTQAYGNALKGTQVDALDPAFINQLNSLRQGVSHLPPAERDVFDRLLQREVEGRMAPNGILSSDNLKQAMSALRDRGASMASSSDAYQRDLGGALKQAGSELMDLVRRTNPQRADELRSIDSAYANFKTAQRAASSLGAREGVFSPAQLAGAIKAGDKTKNKRAFSEGAARMQDLASAGKETLMSKVPDSGTAGRLMGSLTNPLALAAAVPGLVATIPASLLYSRGGLQAASFMINKGLRPTAEGIRKVIAENPELVSSAYIGLGRTNQ